jgi:hypothetical protein
LPDLHRFFRDVFLELTSTTTPHKTEDSLAHLMPDGVSRDEHGNYVFDVGEHNGVMFSSHLDTACQTTQKVNHLFMVDGRVRTDGSTILGADCKTGVAMMLAMIKGEVPGHYVFHAGEECGGIGSHARAKSHADWYRDNIKQCIALDRKGYGSVITHQGGRETCSQEYAKGIITAFGYGAPDNGGTFTDSKSYAHLIPECTNLSVGYWAQHSMQEWQSIPYAHQLLALLLTTDFARLPVARVAKEEFTHGYHTSRGYVLPNVPAQRARAKSSPVSVTRYTNIGPSPAEWEVPLWLRRRLIYDKTKLGARIILPKSKAQSACFMVEKKTLEAIFSNPDVRRFSALSDTWIKDLGKVEMERLIKVKYGGIGYDPHDDCLFVLPNFNTVYWDEDLNELVVSKTDRHVPTMLRDLIDARVEKAPDAGSATIPTATNTETKSNDTKSAT